MAEDLRNYAAMRDAGADPQTVYRAAQDEGLEGVDLIRMLRGVFSLSLHGALAVYSAVELATANRLAASLERHREEVVAPLAEWVELLDARAFQSMDQFPLKWRWTDPRWNELPAEDLARIRPLAAFKAEELCERGIAFYHAFKLRRELFTSIAEFEYETAIDPSTTGRPWLQARSVPEGCSVLVYLGQELAVLTDWPTFVKYWDDFCYPMENVMVWPATEDWAFHHGRNGRWIFGTRADGPVSTQSAPRF